MKNHTFKLQKTIRKKEKRFSKLFFSVWMPFEGQTHLVLFLVLRRLLGCKTGHWFCSVWAPPHVGLKLLQLKDLLELKHLPGAKSSPAATVFGFSHSSAHLSHLLCAAV